MGAGLPAKQCGECGLCCKVVAFPELEKPRGVWCRHRSPAVGCTIHQTRPEACRRFFCLWLTVSELSEEWRPDRAGFFMWEHPVPNGRRLILEIDADQTETWEREPYLSVLRQIADRRQGATTEVILRRSGTIKMLFPEGVIDLGEYREEAIESGYQLVGGALRPYARFVPSGNRT